MNGKTVVSERALLARLNRKLSKDYESVHKIRTTARNYNELGDYAVLDVYRNSWIYMHVDLEQFGREKGVLGTHEKLDN